MFFGRGGPPAQEDNEYYELLGVSRDATEDEIKAAYKKFARVYHPDRLVGKPEEERAAAQAKFQEISHANAVLSDPQQRAKYDQFGKEGLEKGHPGNSHPFSRFFGGDDDDERVQKGKSMKKAFPCTLHDLFNGKTENLPVSRQVICSVCSGTGSNRPGVNASCKKCRGTGATVQMMRAGNTLFQQQVECPDCDGSGSSLPEEDRCAKCHGEKTYEETKEVKVELEKGMQWGQQMCFYGEGHEQPDGVHGDLILQLVPPEDQEKADIQRDGNNIIYQKKLHFVDALCGCEFIYEHFDGKKYLCTVPAGEIVQTGDRKKLPGLGMPVMNKPGIVGDLYFIFLVMLPENITPEQAAQLQAIWPKTKLEYNEAEVTRTQLVQLAEGEGEEESEEDPHEGEGPSCVQS